MDNKSMDNETVQEIKTLFAAEKCEQLYKICKSLNLPYSRKRKHVIVDDLTARTIDHFMENFGKEIPKIQKSLLPKSVVDHYKEKATEVETKFNERVERLKSEKKCENENESYPSWDVTKENICDAGYIYDEDSGCCRTISSYLDVISKREGETKVSAAAQDYFKQQDRQYGQLKKNIAPFTPASRHLILTFAGEIQRRMSVAFETEITAMKLPWSANEETFELWCKDTEGYAETFEDMAYTLINSGAWLYNTTVEFAATATQKLTEILTVYWRGISNILENIVFYAGKVWTYTKKLTHFLVANPAMVNAWILMAIQVRNRIAKAFGKSLLSDETLQGFETKLVEEQKVINDRRRQNRSRFSNFINPIQDPSVPALDPERFTASKSIDDILQSMGWQENVLVSYLNTFGLSISGYLSRIIQDNISNTEYYRKMANELLGNEDPDLSQPVPMDALNQLREDSEYVENRDGGTVFENARSLAIKGLRKPVENGLVQAFTQDFGEMSGMIQKEISGMTGILTKGVEPASKAIFGAIGGYFGGTAGAGAGVSLGGAVASGASYIIGLSVDAGTGAISDGIEVALYETQLLTNVKMFLELINPVEFILQVPAVTNYPMFKMRLLELNMCAKIYALKSADALGAMELNRLFAEVQTEYKKSQRLLEKKSLSVFSALF